MRIVWADTGRRTLKYHQTLDEMLDLADDERALITVLMLRGAQAPGELKTRTERLHPFTDRQASRRAWRRMAAARAAGPRTRAPGGRARRRWVHLLGAQDEAAPVPAGRDREW